MKIRSFFLNKRILMKIFVLVLFLFISISCSQYLLNFDYSEINSSRQKIGHLTVNDLSIAQNYLTRGRVNNTPPYIVKQPEDIDLNEDFGIYFLNLTEYAYDNEDPPELLKWFVTGENKSLINLTNENSTNQQLVIKSVDNTYGDNRIKLWVEDTTGRNDFREINIKIHPINDLPMIDKSNLPILSINPTKPFTIELEPYIIDYDNPISKIKISVSFEDRKYAEINNHLLTFNSQNLGNLDKGYITLEITDGIEKGKYSTAKIKLNISNNFPPEESRRIPEIILSKNERLSRIIDLDYYFSDPDHNERSLSYKHLFEEHIKITIHDDNTVDIHSDPFWLGKEKVIFRCIDPLGAFIDQVVNVSIIEKSTQIVFSSLPDLSIHFDFRYSFNLTPYIKTEIDLKDLNFEIFEFIENDWTKYSELQNIEFMNLDYPIINFNYSKTFGNQSIPIFISVNDGKISKFQELIIKITENYPPKLKKSFPNKKFIEDEIGIGIFDLYEFFMDVENDDLNFDYLGENIQLVIDDNGLVDSILTQDWFGIELVTFRAYDSEGAKTESSFQVSVTPINDAPKIKKFPEINLTKGRTIKINYSNYLFDVDNDITELVVSVEGDHVTLAGDFLILDYPSKLSGVQEFTVKVSDGELSGSQVVKVNIKKIEKGTTQEGVQLSPVILWSVILIFIIMILSLLIISIVYVNRLRRFRFNEIYLIYKDGVLIAHAKRGEKSGYDSDIIGSMFTAIQDFIQESFSDSSNQIESSPLKRLDFGDFQIGINRGDHITVAAVFTGFALRKMLLKIERLRIDIEKKYSDILPIWNGEMNKFKGTQRMIEDLLYSTGTHERMSEPKVEFKKDKNRKPHGISSESKEEEEQMEDNSFDD